MSEKSVVRKNAVRSQVRIEMTAGEVSTGEVSTQVSTETAPSSRLKGAAPRGAKIKAKADDLVTRQPVTADVTAERADSEGAKDDAHQGRPVTKQAVTTSVTRERAWSGRLSSEAKVKRAAKILASHQKQLDRVRALARQLLRELENPHA